MIRRTPRETFFSTLSFGELEDILLSFSHYPHRNEWFENVDDSIKYEVLENTSPFAEVLKEWCCTTLQRKWAKTGEIPIQFGIQVQTLMVAADKLKYVFLSHAKAIQLSSPMFREHFAEQCTSLTHLRVNGHHVIGNEYQVLMSRVGMRLRGLRVDKWIHQWPHLVANYCRLRELFLRPAVRGAVANQPFWQKVGLSLRSLGIFYNGYSPAEESELESERAELVWISQYCPSLRTLILSSLDGVNNTHFAHCLASYGPQLQYTSLQDFKESEARIIARSCPNVRVSVHSDRVEAAARVVGVLGAKVEELSLYSNDNIFRDVRKSVMDLFEASMKKCEAIEKFYARTPISCWFALTITPKPDLLEIDCSTLGTQLITFFGSLAKATGSLRRVKFMTYPPTASALRTLLEANREMREVVLELYPPNNEYREKLKPSSEYRVVDRSNMNCADEVQYRVELVEVLRAAPSLQHFKMDARWWSYVRRYDGISNACVPLRFLMDKLVVIIDRWQYLPKNTATAGSEWHGLTRA